MRTRRPARRQKTGAVLPGFPISLGITVVYLSLLVLIPLSGVFMMASQMTLDDFWRVISSRQVVAAFKVTFGVSFVAAAVTSAFGLIIAWVLTRYQFWGRRFIDGLVDLPFALPTAVAGIALTSVYAHTGWVGRFFYGIGIETAYSRIGIFIALTFIGIPFVVRTLQPVIGDLDTEVEEAAASLGVGRLRIWWAIVFPELLPALLTGFALAFARAIGEYGSVIFISGNMPLRTEIAPLIIVKYLEQYQFAEATGVAAVMLTASFCMLLVVNFLQRWAEGRARGL